MRYVRRMNPLIQTTESPETLAHCDTLKGSNARFNQLKELGEVNLYSWHMVCESARMTQRTPTVQSLAPLLSAIFLACSGTASFENGDAGTAGKQSTGGAAGATGGATSAGGRLSTGGATAGAGGAVICCNAMPVCAPGENQILSQNDCPTGFQCYSLTLCCTQIWCAKGSSDAGTCNPSSEYNRKYMGTSPTMCQQIRFNCPINTLMFSNACGCGCEQAATCPQYIDCMPGPGTSSPLCSDGLSCPYSTRAM